MSTHDFRREHAVEVPRSLLHRLALEAHDADDEIVAAKLENLALGALRPGWAFKCAVCGSEDPKTQEGCR